MTVEAAQPRVEVRARPRDPHSEPLALALDLGASRIRAAVVTPAGGLLARHARPTPLGAGPAAVLAACLASLEQARAALPPTDRARLIAVGVSAPGPLDSATGRLLEPPNLGPAFLDLPLAAPLAEALGLPVTVARDTTVAALAEGAFGAARGVADYIYLTVSSGIGGAVVSDGRLLRGVEGLAGELGHVSVELDGPPCGCGGRGHLEALASGLAIARAAGARDARRVADAELAGDPAASAVMERARRAFAAALVGFVDIFAPRLIVVGGSLAREQGERWLGPAREAIAREAFRTAASRVELVPARLGDDVGLIGAAVVLDLTGRPERAHATTS
jgi:glucokinase